MESDGVEESFEGLVRVAVTAGARFGESLARMREQMAREAEARSLQESRELQARFQAERQAAVSGLSNVQRPDWWDKASPDDIGRAFATAKAWEQHDPEAANAKNRVEDELRNRYGVDVNDVDADPTRVREQVARLEAERVESLAAEERSKEAQERADAERLMREGDQLDNAAEQSAAAAVFEPDPAERESASTEGETLRSSATETRDESGLAYDSAERRSTTAANLEGRGFDQRSVQARMSADVSQGKPVTEAVKKPKAAKARKGRANVGSGKQVTLDR